MKFITIQNQVGETVAINPQRITHIARSQNSIVVFLGNGEQIFTKFTSLKAAVDYVERSTDERSWKPISWYEYEDDL